MGTDIHLHTEVKINGQWYHYSAPNVQRNYKLFEKMAGVRANGSVEPVAKPRGIPNDASIVTKVAYNHRQDDAHATSYINSKEIVEVEEYAKTLWRGGAFSFYDDHWGYLFGNEWNFKETREDYPDAIEDVRFVFWFDN